MSLISSLSVFIDEWGADNRHYRPEDPTILPLLVLQNPDMSDFQANAAARHCEF